MLEMALLSPWIVFLFVGVFDCGFYAYSLITLETAARTAAVWNSTHGTPSDSTTACSLVTSEMQTLVNMAGVTTCGGSTAVTVVASPVTGPDNGPAARVAVTYQTPQLIPIPGLLAGKFTITRMVTMKL